jgi:hypothetical protein
MESGNDGSRIRRSGEQQIGFADLVLTENHRMLAELYIQRFEVTEILDNDSA